MGNNNENINNNQNDELLINQQQFVEKKIIIFDSAQPILQIKNSIFLIKDSLFLEKSDISPSKYYIKFNYDAITNFDCQIIFLVNYKNLNSKNGILIKNISKGINKNFNNKDAIIDIEDLIKKKSENKNSEFDLCIKLISEDNIFMNLCSIFYVKIKEQYKIKIEIQKLKYKDFWIELNDIFDNSINGKCLICYEQKCETIVFPCNHSFACLNCMNSMASSRIICPICKQNIEEFCILKNK